MRISEPTKRVLFLCTGNYYRSRYAEELFNHFAKIEAPQWRALSRGAAERGSPLNAGPISPYTREALELRGIPLEETPRPPQPCIPTDFHNAQLVIGLNEPEHRPLIERRFVTVAHRVSYWHVQDIGLTHPSIALAMIDDHVHKLLSTLN